MNFAPICGGLVALLATACGDSKTASPVVAPGASASAQTRILEAGADALQSKPPIEAVAAAPASFAGFDAT